MGLLLYMPLTEVTSASRQSRVPLMVSTHICGSLVKLAGSLGSTEPVSLTLFRRPLQHSTPSQTHFRMTQSSPPESIPRKEVKAENPLRSQAKNYHYFLFCPKSIH